MDIFMLLDRSGSMSVRWDEAISAVNAYVDEVQTAAGVDLLTDQDRVTLAAFDLYPSTMDFKTLRDRQAMKDWKPVAIDEVRPRGQTPLLDAVVRIAALAEGKASEKTVLVIMTDGHENASVEVTKEGAKAAIGRLQARGWQVVYLGCEFDAFGQAADLGIGRHATMSMARGRYDSGMTATSHATLDYMSRGEQMKYSAEDREASGEADVTGKK